MQTIHLLPLVHLKFRVNVVISVGATFKKLQKSPKNRFFTAFCSILTNVQMTQRLNIWYVYITTKLNFKSMPLVLWELHLKKAFLQHFYSIFSKSALQKILSLMVSVSYCHWLYKTIEKPRVMSFLTQILCQTAVPSSQRHEMGKLNEYSWNFHATE